MARSRESNLSTIKSYFGTSCLPVEHNGRTSSFSCFVLFKKKWILSLQFQQINWQPHRLGTAKISDVDCRLSYFLPSSIWTSGTNGKKYWDPTIGGSPLLARNSFTSAKRSFSTFTHLLAVHAPPIVQRMCIHGSVCTCRERRQESKNTTQQNKRNR